MRRIVFLKASKKLLEKLMKKDMVKAKAISLKIKSLAENPKDSSMKKLTGYSYYRVRVGNYRIIYNYDDESLFIHVIGKRDKVYTTLN